MKTKEVQTLQTSEINDIHSEKSQRLLENLNQLSVENIIDEINYYILKLFILNQKSMVANPFPALRLCPGIEDISFGEFQKKSLSSSNNQNNFPPALSIEANFSFVQRFFLKSTSIKKLLAEYHNAASLTERLKILDQINSFGEKFKPHDLISYGCFGELLDTNSKQSNEEKFNTLNPIQQTSLKQLVEIINLKNEGHKLGFYVDMIKEMIQEIKHPSKFFAIDELMFMVTHLQTWLKKLHDYLMEFDSTMREVVSQKTASTNDHALLDSLNANFFSQNLKSLQEKLTSFAICVKNIQKNTQFSTTKEDINAITKNFTALTQGLVNFLGMPSNKTQGIVILQQEHLDVLATFEKSFLEKEKELYHALEENVLHERNLNKLNGKFHYDVKKVLSFNDRILRDIKGVKAIDKILMKRLKEDVEMRMSNPEHLTEEYVTAAEYSTKLLNNFDICINKLEIYKNAYVQHTENVNLHSCNFFHLHHHGVDGVIRADVHAKKWFETEKAFLLNRFYSKIDNLMGDIDSNTIAHLDIAYIGMLTTLENKITENINGLKGGNRHRHSYKTYLLAYKMEIHQHIEKLKENPNNCSEIVLDRNDLSQWQQIEDKTKTTNVAAIYRALR